MCGINGFNFTDQRLIERMDKATVHRGPDQTATFVGDGVSLGFNRLAIIDLSARGNQPMWDAAHELVIIFNGEIYNYRELREQLKRQYQFRSESDTEVVLYAFRQWGSECVKRFNGMFSFAIWDTRSKELFAARDQIGIKPFYYWYDGQRFIFSSEIKAILEHAEVPRQVDRTAFNLYFQLLYVPEPYTMFAGIRKLPPAHYLKLSGSTMVIERFWQVKDYREETDYEASVGKIRRLFTDAVERQLMADRPVGIFLSGGIDSTAVLGAAAKVKSGKIKTYSVGFKESVQEEKFNADFLLARQTAAYYQTDHHELLIGPADIERELEAIVWHLDEPNSNPTAGAMFLLSRLAKQEVAVSLGGDGGDELFGGYPRYWWSRLISIWQKSPRFFQTGIQALLKASGRSEAARKIGLPPGAARVLAFLGQKQELLASAIAPETFRAGAANDYFTERFFAGADKKLLQRDFERFFMQIDRQSWLVDEALFRSDKMAMALGLEARVPILDVRLVELAARLPTSWKVPLGQRPSHFQGKIIWREAMTPFLPAHILPQQKRGWFTPMSKWVRGGLKARTEECLLGASLPEEFFNRAAVADIWQGHLTGERYNLPFIWALVMWQHWYEIFIKP